jgi:hypothetical protein
MPLQLGDARGAAVGRRIENHDPADVHVGALVGLFELEERRVQRGQPIGHDALPDRRRRGHDALAASTAAMSSVEATPVGAPSPPSTTTRWVVSLSAIR